MNEIKITFTNGKATIDVVWSIVEHKAGRNHLSTQFGSLYTQDYSYLFKTGELVIDVTDQTCDKFEGLLKWINYQFLGTANLFVPVQVFVDPDGKLVETAKTSPYLYKYVQKDWCDNTNTWLEVGLREKVSKLPKSQIQSLSNGKCVAPIWLMSKFLPNCFSKSIECIRIIKKSDLINLMHEHRNKLLSALI
jgi:hypothetical protein